MKTFIDQCSDLIEKKLPIEFQQLFGTPMEIKISYPVRCTYKTEYLVDELPAGCELFMDRGAISGDFVIMINRHLLTQFDFQPLFVYDYLEGRRYLDYASHELKDVTELKE